MEITERFFEITKNDFSQKTVYAYNISFSQFFDYMFSHTAYETETDVMKNFNVIYAQDYKNHLVSKGYKEVSVNAKLMAIVSLLDVCMSDGINKSPYNFMKQKNGFKFINTDHLDRKNNFLNKKESKKVLAAIKDPNRKVRFKEFLVPRDYLLYKLILSTGIRIEEALTLKISDFDVEKMELHILGKRNKLRHNALSDDLISDFDEYMFARKNNFEDVSDDDFLFVSRTGVKLNQSASIQNLHKYCDIAGVKRVSNHDLRHSCATQMLQAGADIETVSETLGHDSIMTTKSYVHTTVDRKRKFMPKF